MFSRIFVGATDFARAHRFAAPPGRGERYTLVSIDMFLGRSLDEKRALCRAMARARRRSGFPPAKSRCCCARFRARTSAFGEGFRRPRSTSASKSMCSNDRSGASPQARRPRWARPCHGSPDGSFKADAACGVYAAPVD